MPETVAIVPYQRNIGGLVAQVTIRESHRDDLVVTEHPVENGANISDHAYHRPSEVEIEIGFSGAAGNPSDFYNQLLWLQANRQPFDVITGKRAYKYMLAVGIATVTDVRTEYSLLAIVRCRRINLVSTQSTVVSTPQGKQADPAVTAPTANQGTKSLVSGSNVNLQSPTWQAIAGQPGAPFGTAGIQGLPGSPSGPSVSP